jgi:hypothetical protein
MRGHRLLFVLASLVALGLVGFANFPSDRPAVADSEASQMVGGQCTYSYTVVDCQEACVGQCWCGRGMEFACAMPHYCANGGNTCGLVIELCIGG